MKTSTKRPLTVGLAALSDEIFVGRLSKDGKTWLNGKQDVTSDVLQSVIHYVGVGQKLTVNVSGKPKYMIQVTEIPDAPASPTPAPWVDQGDDCWFAIHDQGDFDGALVTKAQVHMNGLGQWSVWIMQVEKGRHRKRGLGRINGRCVISLTPDPFDTEGEAFGWADTNWNEMMRTTGDNPNKPTTNAQG